MTTDTKSTEKPLDHEMLEDLIKQNKQLLEENGEIISRFYASHKTMYEDLTKSQSFHYTNV